MSPPNTRSPLTSSHNNSIHPNTTSSPSLNNLVMRCCFSSGVLTRTEREAIARLREQRAQGLIPTSTPLHVATSERIDPFVTFYTNRSQQQKQQKHSLPRKSPPSSSAYRKKHSRRRSSDTTPWVRKMTALQQRAIDRIQPLSIHKHQQQEQEQSLSLTLPTISQKAKHTLRTEHQPSTAQNTHSSSFSSTSSSSSFAAAEQLNKQNPLNRFKTPARRRLKEVKKLFRSNHSQNAERFVLKSKQTPVDNQQQVTDDQYFQELMRSEP